MLRFVNKLGDFIGVKHICSMWQNQYGVNRNEFHQKLLGVKTVTVWVYTDCFSVEEVGCQKKSKSMASQTNIYSQLLISTIRIADINNWKCGGYIIFELQISIIVQNCWCQQVKLRISTFWIVDISNSNCGYPQLLTFIIRITDIDNSNCGYR